VSFHATFKLRNVRCVKTQPAKGKQKELIKVFLLQVLLHQL